MASKMCKDAPVLRKSSECRIVTLTWDPFQSISNTYIYFRQNIGARIINKNLVIKNWRRSVRSQLKKKWSHPGTEVPQYSFNPINCYTDCRKCNELTWHMLRTLSKLYDYKDMTKNTLLAKKIQVNPSEKGLHFLNNIIILLRHRIYVNNII